MTPDMWGQIERFAKAAAKRARTLPEWIEAFKPRLACDSLRPAAMEAGWRLRLFAWDKWSAVDGARDTADHQRRAHANMFSDMHAWMAANDYDQTITGMRADESRGRLMHVLARGKSHTDRAGARWLMPLAGWSVTDVWAYLVSHGLPWLGIYDRMGPDARNGIIGRSGDRFGRAQAIHRHYPEYLSVARELVPDIFQG